MRRKRARLDTTPCVVDVSPSTLVFYDGEQRSGTLHNVPRHLALKWLKYRYVTAVHPMSSGEPASNTAISLHARPGHDGWLGSQSVPAPDSSLPANETDSDPELAGVAYDGDAAAGCVTESHSGSGITAGQRGSGTSPPGRPSGQPGRSVSHGLYGSGEIGPDVCQTCQGCGLQLILQVSRGKRPRKWCSEACRLKAYRERARV